MKIVTIDDAENVILGLQDEIRRSEESRYDHRLHGVLLVAYGMNCCQVADLLGDAPTDGGLLGGEIRGKGPRGSA
jgi:hypothetical protein